MATPTLRPDARPTPVRFLIGSVTVQCVPRKGLINYDYLTQRREGAKKNSEK